MSFRARACPRDHAPLEPSKVPVFGPDIAVDTCPKCAGVFLDKNELLRITGDAKLNAYLRDEVHYDSDSTLVCPHCGGVMDEEEASGCVVDVCLTCFGLWLDAGELERLKARRNSAAIDRAAGKRAEAVAAEAARGRARRGEAAAQGKGVGGAVRRRFVWLDDALDEVVRRWL